MKVNFREILTRWKESLGSLFGQLRARHPRGIMALPGQRATFAKGTLKFPVIDWDKLYKKSFLYNSIALVISAYFVADFLALALTPLFPAPPPPRARIVSRGERQDMSRFDAVLTRNLFNERGLIPNADVGDNLDGPPVRTSLPLTLLGVIVVSDPTKSVASVNDKGSNQVQAVRPGESLGSNVQVLAVEPDRMIFLNRSERRKEFVELPKDQVTAVRRAAPSRPSGGGGIVAEGNTVRVPRDEVDKVMENFNEVLTQARCVPNFEGGRPAGYRCFQIEPGSIYDKLGMKDNDVICGINGQAVNDPATAFNMLNTIKTARNIELCINRNGRTMNMTYEIN